MSNAYKKIEVVGTSQESVSDAIQGAIDRAAATVHDLRWFEVGEIRGKIVDGKIDEYQATIKIGFKLDAPEA